MTHQYEMINSGCYLVWYRADLPVEYLQDYWRGLHGQIANKNPAINEYLQHHFAKDGHGFWLAPTGIGTSIPKDWCMDGMTEVRIKNLWIALIARFFLMKENIFDEQNLFDRCLGKTSKNLGGRWWTGAYRAGTSFRAIVFLRSRYQFKGKPFQTFIHNILAPALLEAGVEELRSHIFQPKGHLLHLTPNVAHDEPINRQYDAVLIIGTQDKETLYQVLESETLKQTHQAQQQYCVAIHAYAVDKTYPLTLAGVPQNPSYL